MYLLESLIVLLNNYLLPEDKAVGGHGVDYSGHWKHGSKHRYGKSSEGTDSDDVFASRSVHMSKHLNKGGIRIHLIVGH